MHDRVCHRRSGWRLIKAANGFSFAEMMVVLGILGIAVAIAIPTIMSVVPSAKESTADSNLKQLNKAVLKFGQANWELVLPADDGSVDDEVSIVRSLQYRNPDVMKASPGSPYISATTSIPDTESSETYRAIWNGRMFRLVPPGEQAPGLDLLEMHEGGVPVQFDSNYKPVGAK